MRPACLRLGEGPVDAQIGGAEAVAQNAVAGHIPDFMAAVQIGYPSAGEIQGQRAIHQRRAHVLFQPVIHGVVDEIMVFQPAPAQLSGGRAFVHLLKMAGQPLGRDVAPGQPAQGIAIGGAIINIKPRRQMGRIGALV